MMFRSIQLCFQRAVVETEGSVLQYQALENIRFDPEAIPARQRFLTRRMKIIQNILRWREFTGEKFGIGGLIERSIITSTLPVAATGWEVGGEYCVRKVRLFLFLLGVSDPRFVLLDCGGITTRTNTSLHDFPTANGLTSYKCPLPRTSTI